MSFFFFKQKTAYEMRISDWSSDVCSSDLEFDTGLTVLWSAVALIALLGAALAWGTDRLVRPLTSLAARISRLRPDQPGQRLEIPSKAQIGRASCRERVCQYV